MGDGPLVGAPSYELHAELRRLHYAQKDISSAESLLPVLEERGHIDGVDWGPIAEGLWTGVTVSYMRPFTGGMRVAERWEVFDGRPDLDARHKSLRTLRDKLFAHTDAASGREVLLMPLGGTTSEERGYVTEQRAAFRHGAIAEVRELFQFQRDRIGERVDALVHELSARGEWRTGDLA